MDATSNVHPYFTHRLAAGPICLATIAHAFNYRVAVLRDGVRTEARVSHFRRAERRILEDTGVPWGHQVAVMLQIVSALELEVPAFLQDIENLQGVYNYPVNHGDMWTILVGIEDVSPRIVRARLCSWFISHSQGGFACAGVGGLPDHYRDHWRR